MKVHPVHSRVRPSRAPASQNPVHRRGGYPWRDGPVESNQGRKPAKPEQLSRIPAMTRPSGRMQKIAHPRAFSRFGGAAAPQQATKKKNQRSRNSNLCIMLQPQGGAASLTWQVHSKKRKHQIRKRMLSINHERDLLH